MTWFQRATWAGVGFCASTLITHAEPEYAAHPDWHIPLGLLTVGLMTLLAVVAESAAAPTT